MKLFLAEGNDTFASGAHTLSFGPVRDRYETQLLELARMVSGEIPNPCDRRHDTLVEEVLLAASGCMQYQSRR